MFSFHLAWIHVFYVNCSRSCLRVRRGIWRWILKDLVQHPTHLGSVQVNSSCSFRMILRYSEHSMAFPHLHLAYNEFCFVLQTPWQLWVLGCFRGTGCLGFSYFFIGKISPEPTKCQQIHSEPFKARGKNQQNDAKCAILGTVLSHWFANTKVYKGGAILCHCIQARIPVIESGSFRRYSPWLCPCTSSILLGTLVTHSSCLHLHSLSRLLHAAPLRFPCRILSLTRSLPSWSAWKKTHQMSPISLEKRPTPGQEAEAAFFLELYGFQVTWCDMMWHDVTLCYITVLSLVVVMAMHGYGTRCWSEVWSVKRFKIATRASNIWRMMELFLQRGPKRLQFAARHGKTEATKSIYKPCSDCERKR